jgi:hypothetical protein
MGAPVPLDISRTFFVAGEQMTYELSLRGILGGEATVAVGQPGVIEGKNVVIVRSRVESAGVVSVIREVRDDVTTWIDLETGRPIYLHADVKFGNRESIIETRFNRGRYGSFHVHFEPKGMPVRTLHQIMPARQAAFDGHSIMGVIRAWEAAEGDHAYFYVLAGQRLWLNTVRMTGRETIKTSLGRFPAVRIDGIAQRLTRTLREEHGKEPRHFSMWVSDDDDRKPLLIVGVTEFGDVRAELVDYQRPDLPAISATER